MSQEMNLAAATTSGHATWPDAVLGIAFFALLAVIVVVMFRD